MRTIQGVEMYSTKEVSEIIGVTCYTVSQLRKRGLIKSVRLGRVLYTSNDSIQDYLRGRTAQTGNEDNGNKVTK